MIPVPGIEGQRVYYFPPVELTDDHYTGIPAVVTFYHAVALEIRIESDQHPLFPRGSLVRTSPDNILVRETPSA